MSAPALVIGHRGASAYEPENSLAAFVLAGVQGADGVELDVHVTADGALVVHHDPVIEQRRICELDLDAVRAYRLANGEPVPTLAEALEVLGTSLLAFIEVKDLPRSADAQLFRVIDEAPAPPNYRIHAFDHRLVRRLYDRRPAVPTGVLSASYPIDPVGPVRAARAAALWQQQELIDAPLAAALHAADLRLYAWTVDAPPRMRELLALGVDGVCTNRPDVAREVIG